MGARVITQEPDFEFFQKAHHYRQALKGLQSRLPDWRLELTDLAFANDCAFSAVISVFERGEGISLLQIDEDLQRRSAVSAAMFQNIALVEAAIQDAQYVGASTLVRQELEGVESLRGILEGKQVDGSTPRLKAFGFLGRIYGQLSGISHLSMHEGLDHLTGGLPYSYDAAFNRRYAEHLLNCHVLALCGLASITAFDSRGIEDAILTEMEETHLSLALSVLCKNGFLKLAAPTN